MKMSEPLTSRQSDGQGLARPMAESQMLALSALALVAAAWLLIAITLRWQMSLAAPGFFIAFYLAPALLIGSIRMLIEHGWRARLIAATTMSLVATALFGGSFFLLAHGLV